LATTDKSLVVAGHDYTADSIVSLQGLERVTQMPNIFVGNRGSYSALFQMIKESVDNSNDEAAKVENLNIKIIFFYNQDKTTYQCVVIDNGRGIPVTKIKPSFTEEATSGKYRIEGQKNAYGRSSGTFGRGAKALAGLSEICTVVSSQNKEEEGTGILVVKNAQIHRSEVVNEVLPNGTIVFHEPSTKYFEKTATFIKDGISIFFDYVEFLSAFEDKTNITVIFKEGLVSNKLFDKSVKDIYDFFHQIDGSGKKEKVMYSTDKTVDHVEYLKQKLGIGDEIVYRDFIEYDDPEALSFKIHMVADDNFSNMSNMKFISAVNNSPISTPDSHHIFVLMNILKDRLSKYSDSPKIQKFVRETYKFPMYFSINVYWNGVVYEDLLKSIYRDAIFSGAYYTVLSNIFSTDDYVVKFQTLYDLLKDHIEEQYNKYTFKSIAVGGVKNISSKLNKSNAFSPCKSKDKEVNELYLVEGETAANLLNEVRLQDTQAIMALGGKPVNIFKSNVEEAIRSDKVFRDLTMVLGIKPGDPIENINYKKIFIATDPDAHGAHIAALLIGNFYSINPAILENGYVYIIVSPKYSLTYRKHKTFIKDFDTLFRFKVNAVYKFLFDFSILVGDKEVFQITKDVDIFMFCKVICNLGELRINTAKNLGMIPSILEKLVENYKYLFDINGNAEILKESFGVDRVVLAEETNTLLLFKNEEDTIVPMNNVRRDIRNNILREYQSVCKEVWQPIISVKGNEDITNLPITILELYYLLEEASKEIRTAKFKGLGSMKKEDVEATCISPATRTYMKINSIGSVQTLIDMLGKDTNERKYL